MKKRLLATLLVLAMLLSVMPVGIVTAEEAAEPEQCDHITGGWTAWGDEDGQTSSLPTSGEIYLTKDVSLAAALQLKQADHDLSICLNGHTITAATDGYRLFRVSGGAKLHICNCGQTGGISDVNSGTSGGAVAYIARATVELVNVNVTNNTNTGIYGGGAFWMQVNSSLSITGGKVSGNSSAPSSDSTTETLGGGAIFAHNGGTTITINGTEFSNNSTTKNGGAITSCNGVLNISNALFTGNSNAGGGASAIYGEAGAAINLIDTTITGNTNTGDAGSGAVYIAGDSSAMTLSGKVIVDDNAMLSGTERNIYFYKEYGGSMKNVVFVNGLADGSRLTVTTDKDRSADANTLVQVSTAQGAEQVKWDPAWVKYENTGAHVHYNQTTFTYGHSHAEDSGWTAWDGTGTAPTSGKIYLTKNVDLAERIVLTNTALTLCLNGYTMRYSGTDEGKGQLFRLDQTAQLTICDCTAYTHDDIYHAGKITGGKTGAVIFVGSSTATAKLTLQDGIITGNTNAGAGGGIIVQGAGAFHMEGGEIRDNRSTGSFSGAVYTSSSNTNGSFVMTGGRIYGNTAQKAGGGVYVNGSTNGATVKILGGEISGNQTAAEGAGVYALKASVTIEDCTISKNTATGAGGAVYLSSGSCTITDSKFTRNSGTNGGTLYGALSSYTISGTTFTDNTATGNGNLFGKGTSFTLTETTITGNHHTADGASAIYCEANGATNSSVQLTDCTITGNESTDTGKGAVYISGTGHPLTVSGKTMIIDNTIEGGAAGNVYFDGTYAQGGHAQLYVNGLAEGSRIGVTTAADRTDANTVVKVSTAEGAAQTNWDVAWITYQNNGKNVFYNGTTFSFDHIHTDEVEYTQTTTLPTASGEYVLVNDVTISSEWTIGSGKQITLCLNGHDITLQEGISARLISLKDSAQLTICDCTGHTTEETVEGELVQTYHAGKLSGGNETGTGGGAVFVRRGTTFTLHDGIICGNVSHTAGGAVLLQAGSDSAEGGIFHMYGGEISGNACKNMGTGKASGGAVYVGGTFKMYGGTIKDNTSTKNGGAVYITDAGAMTVTGGTFCDNESELAGGAIYNEGSLTINKAQDSTVLFSGNQSGGGKSSGAIRHEGTAMSITGAEFVNNTAASNAGAIYADRTGSLTDCTFTGNSAPNHGGALYCSADFTISGCTFTENHSTVSGGGALAVFGGAEVTVSGSTFTGNTCASSGGALYANKSTLILQEKCVVSGNTANNNGGAFYGDTADFTVADSVITGNTVTRADADNGSAFSLSNGGTIYIQDGAYIHDNGLTIATIATSGGTINISGGTITETNCTDSAIAVYSGNMTMTDGTITGCTGSKGVVYFDGTTFDMSGGAITNNPTRGVLLNKGTMNLSGTGEVSYNNWNVAGSDGAGIRVNNDAHLEMTGGIIRDNHCTNRKYATSGGGINIRGTANLLGGEIYNNSAHNAGGVLVRSNLTTIGGTCHIHDNKAYNQGGGILVYMGNLDLQGDAIIAGNTAVQGGGLCISRTADTVNINDGTITGNTVANGDGYDNEGNLTGELVLAQGAAVLALGGVVNLNGGVITNTNAGTIYGTAVYIGNAAYVTLSGTKLENIPDDDDAETPLGNTVYLYTGAIPMKVTPAYVKAHTDGGWERIRTSMNGYGRFAQGTVADQDGTYTSYTDCFSIKADCDRNQMLRPVDDHLYMTPSTKKVFTLTYVKDGEPVTQKLNHFEDIYNAYKNALTLADEDTTPYIDLNASYQGIPVELTNDLYLHMNGYSLHSRISAAAENQQQVTIYGTDTATDDYGKEGSYGSLRIAMIVDGNGEKSTGGITVKNAWQSTTKTGSAKNKRYMAAITNTSENYRDTEYISDLIEDQTGFKQTADDGVKTYAEGPYYWFSFHRFYAGVTHSNLNGRMRGLGYKAVFAGDSVVKEHLKNNGIAAVTDDGSETAEFGFYLWLEDSEGNELSEKMAYGVSADAFVAEDTSANTYVWRVNDILLDEEDEKDVAVATGLGYATVDAWNQDFKDVVVCAQPFMCLDRPAIPNASGGDDAVDNFETVTTSTYRFTMQQLLELVDANVETYYPTTIDWDGLVGFCRKFETYFAGWSISNIINYAPAAVSQS